MENEVLKSLISNAMKNGQASFQAWEIDFLPRQNELIILHNGARCAHFQIEGFERGYLYYDGICSKGESPVLQNIELYMTGAAI